MVGTLNSKYYLHTRIIINHRLKNKKNFQSRGHFYVGNAVTFCIFFLVLVRKEEELNQVSAENNNWEKLEFSLCFSLINYSSSTQHLPT
jgi:arginine exporter protein ArgO